MFNRRKFNLVISGQRIRLGERTLIMGVLNVTPDSFSDGGLYFSPRRAIAHGLDLAAQGADWIDVGGESTRPGAEPVSAAEELRRVIPVIEGLHGKMPSLPISIDTMKSDVAEEAVCAGATIINDVSGLRVDRRLAAVARRYHTPLVLMHMHGRPATMQQGRFPRAVWQSVRHGLEWSIRTAREAGAGRSQLIVDPGLGFGKSRRQNYEILARLEKLAEFHLPVLVGTSRKSFIQAIVAGKELGPSNPRGRVESSTEATADRMAAYLVDYWAMLMSKRQSRKQRDPQAALGLKIGDASAIVATILGGAHIVRVHDVKAAIPAIRIGDAILNGRTRA